MFGILRTSLIAAVFGLASAAASVADDHQFRLSAPADLVESGLLKFILPRFSLKTQVRIEVLGDDAAAEAAFGSEGTPVFEGLDRLWRLAVAAPDHEGVAKFVDWIKSEAGQRAITGYRPDDSQPFTLPAPEAVETVALVYDGDAAAGMTLSHVLCGRCHVVSERNRMNAIGSTPSFFALRTLSDWENRFGVFYVLNPHPAFTQVADVTQPFSKNRPPPIVPLGMTLEDLDAIIAYVASLEPADLGAPIAHQ